MTRALFGRVDRLEDRREQVDDTAGDARVFESMMHGLAARLTDADRFATAETRRSWAPALQSAWRMQFLGESIAEAVTRCPGNAALVASGPFGPA